MNAKIFENDNVKLLRSEGYNFNFDKRSGFFARWGKTESDDPSFSPFGPEIMDIEISEGEGCPLSCPFCYKGNKKGNNATNMSLDTFKKIFATFPKITVNATIARNGRNMLQATPITVCL